ncbi:hypothetical protein C2R22_14280 [Salinigranum rubrum]|uniref:Uncharacterized protein n=1 Tax=Salinigranum rubrum TaxID=755307 RepID=A0A2I8VL96_9EURY|nr:hypothetical protein C2R22_14280 [Salinigranum rubrum]
MTGPHELDGAGGEAGTVAASRVDPTVPLEAVLCASDANERRVDGACLCREFEAGSGRGSRVQARISPTRRRRKTDYVLK